MAARWCSYDECTCDECGCGGAGSPPRHGACSSHSDFCVCCGGLKLDFASTQQCSNAIDLCSNGVALVAACCAYCQWSCTTATCKAKVLNLPRFVQAVYTLPGRIRGLNSFRSIFGCLLVSYWTLAALVGGGSFGCTRASIRAFVCRRRLVAPRNDPSAAQKSRSSQLTLGESSLI